MILLAALMLIIALFGLLFKDRILARIDHSESSRENREEGENSHTDH